MGLVLAISVNTKAAAVLIYTAVIAPLIGFGINRVAGGWNSYGGGPFAILKEPHGRGKAAAQAVDPAIQAAEVRQMLAAKAERQRERGEPALDVEAESARPAPSDAPLSRPASGALRPPGSPDRPPASPPCRGRAVL